MYRARFLERHALTARQVDLQFLEQIAKAYSALPYENVTKILKDARSSGTRQKFRLSEEVFEDHLRWNTGGTCFSLCNALQELLTSCGFDAFIAMGDMHYGANIHCAIIVRMQEDSYLLDPGYLIHQPLLLPDSEIRFQTSMNRILLKNEGEGNYSLFTQEHGTTKWRYRLKAIETPRGEFEAHWEHPFSLNSMEHVILTRTNETGRLYYRKDRLELVQLDQRTKQKVHQDDYQLLSNIFHLPADLIHQAQKVKG